MTARATTLRFIRNIDFSDDYNDVVLFNSEAEQADYFLGQIGLAFEEHSYQRPEAGYVKVSRPYTEMTRYCYLMFKNSSLEDKWWYAFIDEVTYINDTTTGVRFHLDIMQSYMFRYELGASFVVREHPSTDEPGDNVIPENLDVGYYEYESTTQFKVDDAANTYNDLGYYTMEDYSLVVAYNPQLVNVLTLSPKLADFVWEPSVYTGVYQGVCFLVVPMNQHDTRTDDFIKEVDGLLNAVSILNQGGIICCFMMPTILLPEQDEVSWRNRRRYMTIERNTKFGSYVPRNKKLLTWPYTCANLTSHRTEGNDFAFERFTTPGTASFVLEGNFSTNPSAICYPLLYKEGSVELGVTIPAFPIATWSADGVTEWLSNNLFSCALGVATAAGTAFVGAGSASIGAMRAATSGAKFRDKDSLRAEYQTKQALKAGGAWVERNALGIFGESFSTPARNVGGATGEVVFGNQETRCIWGRVKRITQDYAERIDAYFDRYGYATNTVKEPDLKSRPYWNYIQLNNTRFKNINCPMSVVEAICNVYERGVTFWRPHAVIGDYTNQKNSV